MAEAIVSIVLQKLSSVAIQEAIFLHGVKDELESVKRELVRIQAFLKDADSKRKDDNRVETWVKEVRGVSCSIEDAIDTFLVEVWRNDQKGDTIKNLTRVVKKPMKLFFTHKLGIKIKDIQARIKEISASRKTYGIKNLGESSQVPVNPVTRPIVVPDIEREMVGSDNEENDIIQLLLDENTLRRRVVSIVGQGGLGKTTLTQKVYRSTRVKNHFDFLIWLTISKEFNPIELLKDILRQLRRVTMYEKYEKEEYFAGEINELLRNNKYLIVLDDIWKDNTWSDLFEPSFPDNNNGSRVLFTTRFSNVAKLADFESIYELRYLNNDESLELLLKKAIPKEDEHNDNDYSRDLLHLAREFVKKCGGLPLALVVVGGLLSTKIPNYIAWERVFRSIDWHSEENKCTLIISTIYEDLPLPLKSCFIYLSVFPADYVIEAEFLIQLWVAEGLIPDEMGKIIEDTANNYLDELAQRCMIIVVQRSFIDGSIQKFRVHDVLHDLAIHEAKEKEFVNVIPKSGELQSTDIARRTSFRTDNSFEEKFLTDYIKPNVRTLFFFKNVVSFDSQLNLLTVLVVEGYSNKINIMGQPPWVNHLKMLRHLRCVAFIRCAFYITCILPVDHWHNLQTLNLRGTYGVKVPRSLWDRNTLRHVIGSNLHLGPANLPNLQTLDCVVTVTPHKELIIIPNLRKLSLADSDYYCWKTIVALLPKLSFLVSLVIKFYSWAPLPPEFITLLSSNQRLQTLKLEGEWSKSVAINDNIFPSHLVELVLVNSKIDQNLIAVLEKLQSLKTLNILSAYVGNKIICSNGGFCQLLILKISSLPIKEWEIEEGALPVLKKLEIVTCLNLRELPQLQHITTLEHLHLDMSGEFNKRVQNEEQHKIKHIHKVTFRNAC